MRKSALGRTLLINSADPFSYKRIGIYKQFFVGEFEKLIRQDALAFTIQSQKTRPVRRFGSQKYKNEGPQMNDLPMSTL